jgi:predicted secreted acid phosphatase
MTHPTMPSGRIQAGFGRVVRCEAWIESRRLSAFIARMSPRLPLIFALAVALLAPLPAAQPRNLSQAKDEVYLYINSGKYGRDLTKVAVKAGKYLAKRVTKPLKEGEKRAIVFDIDETTLTNLSHITAHDFGYVPAVWKNWVSTGQARAIVPVQLVYDVAVRNNVAVFFITARNESERAVTERNLRQVGYTTWTKVYFEPDGSEGSSRAYKTGIRRQLAADGYTIIANIGDQESDLAGGFAQRTFKLPNPFYQVK